ncbi:ankyrin repeat domain-containing protein [Deinococcus koreensis]|uniref:ankyrin repeat domain-containing protein n=1 Tax=Deinococcus koreensis TaxID=2054903 RepID=UPI000DD76BF2|nr:ankyrin repeat domain-containing protein [Deinococcus koreensis]
MSDFESPTHELVANAHGNLERVRALLDAHPELADTRYAVWNESPLEAAAHTGGREIAELLLVRGAAPNHVAWAMLGRVDELRAMLDADPALAQIPGAHGIGLLYHAALSGDTKTLDAAWNAGARAGLEKTPHAAVQARSLDALRWALAHGAALDTRDMRGQTPLEAARERGWEEGTTLLGDS